jgi:molecular chaperone IbpA
MTNITSLDLTPFYRNSIGIDRLFDRITNQFDAHASTSYPPYNIIKTAEDSYSIEVAVAGFNEGDIDVTFHDGQLIITGEQRDKAETETTQFLHRGISARKFVRTFQLAEYVEVQNAVVKNGILTVELKHIVPDTMKPKSIAITYTK